MSKMKTKLIILALSIIFILLIARDSLGWAIAAGVFLFILGCWLNVEPKQDKNRRDKIIAREARVQNELINNK